MFCLINKQTCTQKCISGTTRNHISLVNRTNVPNMRECNLKIERAESGVHKWALSSPITHSEPTLLDLLDLLSLLSVNLPQSQFRASPSLPAAVTWGTQWRSSYKQHIQKVEVRSARPSTSQVRRQDPCIVIVSYTWFSALVFSMPKADRETP